MVREPGERPTGDPPGEVPRWVGIGTLLIGVGIVAAWCVVPMVGGGLFGPTVVSTMKAGPYPTATATATEPSTWTTGGEENPTGKK